MSKGEDMKFKDVEKDCKLKMNINSNIECLRRRLIISGLDGCLCREDNCFKNEFKNKYLTDNK